MNFPVIVKDTLGAGSIGVEVMNSYEEVESFLNSNRNNSDIMVEELIQGEQFGTEIHGVEGRYSVLPPMPSVTKRAFDPLSSVKFGPVTDPSYHLKRYRKNCLIWHRVRNLKERCRSIWFTGQENGILSKLIQMVRNDNNNGCHGGKKSTIYFCGQHTRN